MIAGWEVGGLLAAAPFRQGTCSPAHQLAALSACFPHLRCQLGPWKNLNWHLLRTEVQSSDKSPAMGVHSLASHLGEPLYAM